MATETERVNKIEFNRVTRHVGSYDFAHPSDKQVNFMFVLRSDAPAGLPRSVVLSLEQADDIDLTDTPEGIAKACLSHCRSYIFHDGTETIPALIEYLASKDGEDARDQWRAERVKLSAEVKKSLKKLATLEACLLDETIPPLPDATAEHEWAIGDADEIVALAEDVADRRRKASSSYRAGQFADQFVGAIRETVEGRAS